LIRSPGRVAIARAVLRPIVGKGRRIKWRVESRIAHYDSASQRQTEGLDPTVKILVIDRVFVMPEETVDAGNRARHFVGNKTTAIYPRLGFDRIDGRASPGIDGRGRSHRGTNGPKCETRRAADTETAVGRVVIHVALTSMSLAPGVFMRSDILRFGVIGRSRIRRCIQIGRFHQNPVRRAIVRVT
jgi:hypothetical protein